MLNLVFGGHFFRIKLRRVSVNYHAKSGASSSKMLNLDFDSFKILFQKMDTQTTNIEITDVINDIIKHIIHH